MPEEDADDDGWDMQAQDDHKAREPPAKSARALVLTVVEASNLPLPAAFSRRGRHGHLPVGTPAPGMNPYAVVRHAESRRATAPSPMNAWPRWGAAFEFALQVDATTAARPWREPDADIVIEVMNEDRFTVDTLVGSAAIAPSKVNELLTSGEVGAVMQLLLPLTSPVGVPLCGAGAQRALVSVRLEIAEVMVPAAKEEEAAPAPLAAEPRSPEKLREDSEMFFEKLQQSPGAAAPLCLPPVIARALISQKIRAARLCGRQTHNQNSY
jgi:hypothetical protein